MKLKKIVLNLLRVIFSVGLIAFLFSKIGLQQTLDVMSKTNIPLLILSSFVYILTLFLTYLSVQLIISSLKTKVTKIQVFRSWALSFSLGSVIPGKLGEMAIPLFLRKYGARLGETTLATIADKFIATLIPLILTFIGLKIFVGTELFIKITLISIPAVIIVMILFFTRLGTRIISKILHKKLAGKFDGFYKASKKVINDKNTIILVSFVNIIRWIITALFFQILFLSLNTRISFIEALLIPAMTTIIATIPLTIGGLGLRESGAVYLFSLVGIEGQITFSVFILFNLLKYLIVVIFVAAFNKEFHRKTSENNVERSDGV